MAVTLDYQIEVSANGGTVLFGPSTNYIITDFDALDLPEVRFQDVDRPNTHGIFVSPEYLGKRSIKIPITIRGDTSAAVVSAIDAIKAVWRPSASSALATLTFQLPGQTPRIIYGRPRKSNFDAKRIVGRRADVVLEFVGTDPRIYDATPGSWSASLAVSTGGRTYPRTYPRTYGGSSTGGVIYAVNSGTFPTPLVATITGPPSGTCNNPRIENVTDGVRMTVNTPLVVGDTLVIDFDAHSILLNGATRRSLMSADSSWWYLNPGTTEIRFFAGTYQAGVNLTIAASSARL